MSMSHLQLVFPEFVSVFKVGVQSIIEKKSPSSIVNQLLSVT